MSADTQHFTGTDQYIATDSLKLAVKAARALQKPLLVKGEPGTGKTLLAEQVAESLGLKLITWHIKSTTKAQQGLYEYDAVSRLRDSQLGDDRVYDIKNYIKPGKLWEAFTSEERCVLLIDEIDKADIEFPNDLLHELDKMSFYVYETGKQLPQLNDLSLSSLQIMKKNFQMHSCVVASSIILNFLMKQPCVTLLLFISQVFLIHW
jgi:MoxR-like ATPase